MTETQQAVLGDELVLGPLAGRVVASVIGDRTELLETFDELRARAVPGSSVVFHGDAARSPLARVCASAGFEVWLVVPFGELPGLPSQRGARVIVDVDRAESERVRVGSATIASAVRRFRSVDVIVRSLSAAYAMPDAGRATLWYQGEAAHLAGAGGLNRWLIL